MQRRRQRPEAADQRRPATTAGRSSPTTARASSGGASTSTGLLADVWTMKLDGTDAKQITDFGSMSWAPYEHPSGEYFIFSSNKLGFENFELFIVDTAGHEGAGARHLHRRLRRPAGALAGRQAARVDVEPRRRRATGQMFLAQWNHEKALEALRNAPPRKPSREIMNTYARPGSSPACGAAGAGARRCSAPGAGAAARARKHAGARHGARLGRARGRLAGIDRRTARRATTSSRSCSGSARSRCPGKTDFLLPFEFTAGTRDGGSSVAIADDAGRPRSQRRTGRPGAVVLRQRRRDAARSCSPATASSCRRARISATTATRRSTSRTRSSLVLRYFPEDADTEDQGHSRALLRPALQGDGGAAARREGDARRHRPAFAECRRDRSRCRSIRRSPDRASSPPASAARWPTRCSSARRPGEDARRGAEGARLLRTRTSPGSRCPNVTVDDAHRRRPREADRPQRRRLPAGDRRRPARARSRGSRSARTTTTSVTARTAIRSRRRTTPARFTHGADDNASGTAAVLAVGERSPRSRAAATCCSSSGRARSSG